MVFRKTVLKWVCTRSTLNIAYKSYILPLITNYSEPLKTANDQVLIKVGNFTKSNIGVHYYRFKIKAN